MKRTVKHIIISVIILALAISFAACAWLDIGGTTTTTKPTTTEPAHTCKFGEWVVETEPTHKEVGSRYQLCECGKENREEIPVTPHEFGEWVVYREASHVEDEYAERECACGEKEVRYTSLGHNVELISSTKSDYPCVGDSEKWYCHDCEEEFWKNTAPTAEHVPDYDGSYIVWAEATCKSYSTTGYDCAVCGQDYVAIVVGTELADCVFGEWVEVTAPSCTKDGLAERACTNTYWGCENKETKTLPMVECNFGEWVEVKAPTCTADGLRERTCTYECGNKETEIIKGGHEEVYTPNYDDRLVTVTCSKCNETVKTIPFAEGLTYEPTTDGSGYIVTGKGTCNSTEVVIPNEYEGKPVVGIGAGAFWASDITYLGVFATHEGEFTFTDSALKLSESLVKVDITADIVTFEISTFAKCYALTTITLNCEHLNVARATFDRNNGNVNIYLPFAASEENTRITYKAVDWNIESIVYIHFTDKTVEYNGLEN